MAAVFQTWRTLTFLSMVVTCTLYHKGAAATTDCATGTGNLMTDHSLPQASEASYLLSNDSSPRGIQVIVPQMAFGCPGRIMAWSGHTLVLTKPNFVDVLTHHVAMQVWRPSPETPGKYTLVGSNRLTFADSELRNGITNIAGVTETAFFSFTNKTVLEEDQIYFQAGDVVGWYVYPQAMSIDVPLSPLYRAPLRSDTVASVVELVAERESPEACTLCNTSRHESINDMVPLISVSFTTGQELSTCSETCGDDGSQTTSSQAPPQTTQLNTDSSPTNDGKQAAAQSNEYPTSDVVCIVIAVITLVMHFVLISLCVFNCIVLKEIRGRMRNSIRPQSPSLTQRAEPFFTKSGISNEAPANYPSNSPPIPQDYERAQESSSPYELVDGSSKTPHKNSLHLKVMENSKTGSESPALSNRSMNNSLTDLLNA